MNSNSSAKQGVSKQRVIGSLATCFILFPVLFFGGLAWQDSAERGRDLAPWEDLEQSVALGLAGLGIIAGIYGVVLGFKVWYKAWASINDGHARTTPGKAIGFLFIPFFNIFWVFQSVYGLAQDYNRFLDRHALVAVKLPEKVFLAYCVFALVSVVPYLGLVAIAVNLVLLWIMLWKICDAINVAVSARGSRQGPAKLELSSI